MSLCSIEREEHWYKACLILRREKEKEKKKKKRSRSLRFREILNKEKITNHGITDSVEKRFFEKVKEGKKKNRKWKVAV